MKQLFFCMLFTLTLLTTVSAQSLMQDSLSSKKVILTLQHHHQSKDFEVESYSFTFSKTQSYVIDGQAMRGDLMVSIKKFTPFLLQAVGGDSTNVVKVKLVVYDSSGQKQTGLQMNQALITTTATSFQKNYGTDISVGFSAQDIVIDEVEL